MFIRSQTIVIDCRSLKQTSARGTSRETCSHPHLYTSRATSGAQFTNRHTNNDNDILHGSVIDVKFFLLRNIDLITVQHRKSCPFRHHGEMLRAGASRNISARLPLAHRLLSNTQHCRHFSLTQAQVFTQRSHHPAIPSHIITFPLDRIAQDWLPKNNTLIHEIYLKNMEAAFHPSSRLKSSPVSVAPKSAAGTSRWRQSFTKELFDPFE